ncbi:MAG: DUF4838 domain-containing protein [Chitinophagaceae bacterium]
MQKTILLFIQIFFIVTVQAQQFTLVNTGKSTYRIIIPQKATVIEIQAAKVFQDYIRRISGAVLPIEADNESPIANEILIGNVSRPELKDVPLEKLKQDGLYVSNRNKKLVITGGTGKGTLYGVYTFLEKYLGCRKYSSAVTYVPKKKTIVLHAINDMEVPAVTYREDFYPDAYDPEYMDWHKLDSHYGKYNTNNEWGSFVHTMDDLISTKEYGNEHPEYFSFYDGQRHPGQRLNGQPEAQPCLSNPEVFEIVCKNLLSNIQKNPAAMYWSVSQNDNINYCRCPDCTKLDEKYAAFTPGSKVYRTHSTDYLPIGMGSLLTFVNKVAERFPDKTISTLAYQYTRVPPRDLVPLKNVNIMLCNIESPRNIPIEAGDTSFCNDLSGWAKMTNNIIVWDYVVQYRNLISPFPNLHVLQPNLKYLTDKGVTAYFEEGNPETGGEFSELKAYLIAKLLWNPNENSDKIMDDFLSGYYGNASKHIRAYIDLLQNKMTASGAKLIIYATPVEEKETFLSDTLITTYNQLFDRAEKAVAVSPEILQRVQTARLPVYYAMLEIARAEKTGKRGAFISDNKNMVKPNPKITKILYDFVYRCIQTNVTHISEGRTTPQQYLEGYSAFLIEGSGNTVNAGR